MNKAHGQAPELVCIDAANACLRRGSQAISLTPKAFSVLQYLSEHPARLVTKQELIEAVWPRGFVTDGVLKACIHEIRKALDDPPAAPRYIETLHRRGYRLIRDLRAGGAQPLSCVTASLVPTPTTLIGRDEALTRLYDCLARAQGGHRQVVFVGGEAGIGKTTVVDAFAGQVAQGGGLLLGRGQCIEQYSAGEAYSPVLEGLNEICRRLEDGRGIPLLSRYAPSWLAQLPWLSDSADKETLQRETLNPTRERMLREMSELLEALTAQTPILLVLEDLHWGDHSTIDLISMLARRREVARLMLVITYRPVEVILTDHPLKSVKQDLQVRGCCEDLPLSYFNQEDVDAYLAVRFAGHELPSELAAFIHARTEGNPLFIVNVVDYLHARETITLAEGRWRLSCSLEDLDPGVPENLRQMIDRQIERQSPEEQRLLEAASVAGSEFAAAVVAAALHLDADVIEERLLYLARRMHFLRAADVDEWPDGTVSGRYAFVHALYQNVLYQRQPAASRMQFHRRIGERLERGFAIRTGKIAAELSLHFEQAKEYHKAVAYLRQAAAAATARYTHREAEGYLTRALDMASRLSALEREDSRMKIFESRGQVRRLMANMQGAAADFSALAAIASEQSQLDRQAVGLISNAAALAWVDRGRCLVVVAELETLAAQLDNESLRAHARGWSAYWHLQLRGWRDRDARACAAAVRAARRAQDPCRLNLLLGRSSYFHSLRSRYLAASRTAAKAARLALETGSAFEYMVIHFFWAWSLLHLGQWGQMHQVLTHGIEVTEKNGQHLWAMLLRLEFAWLSIECFDFATARDLAARGIEEARQWEFPYGEMVGAVLLGHAQLGLGESELAFQHFDQLRRRLARERIWQDWVWRMPLYVGLSEYWCAQGDHARARQFARRLRAVAARPGERTYQALARRTLTQVAMAQGHFDEAKAELSRALELLPRASPLARWRVYATAAEYYQQQGQNADATNNFAASAAVLTRLAGALTDVPQLHQSLLKAAPVREILRREMDGV